MEVHPTVPWRRPAPCATQAAACGTPVGATAHAKGDPVSGAPPTVTLIESCACAACGARGRG
eukprot:5282895-Prymnesium_polylepis.1